MIENKNSFFILRLILTDTVNSHYRENLEDKVDIILAAMSVGNDWFQYKSQSDIVYFFQTTTRKRKGQVVRQCERILNDDQEFNVQALTKQTFEDEVHRIKFNKNYKLLYKPIVHPGYSEEDIKILDNENNWLPWEKKVYNLVFNKDGSIKKAKTREIVNLVDIEGNSGKSTFFKWILVRNPKDVVKLTYGSSAQLRTAIINHGAKKLYIIDLPRTKGANDRKEDLLSALEDLKLGSVISNLYGSGAMLNFDPPHIIVTSNMDLPYEYLSEDRWVIFEIRKDNLYPKIKKSEIRQLRKDVQRAYEKRLMDLGITKRKQTIKKF
jgi:hypothetical protein